MNDVIDVVGPPTPLTVGGETYDLYNLSLADLAGLQAWINSQFKHPLDAIRGKLDGFPIEVQKYLSREAMHAACKPAPKLGMAEATALLISVEGLQEILFLSIRKGRPDFTRDDVAALCRVMSFDDAAEIVERTGILSIKPKVTADMDADAEPIVPKA